MEDIYMDLGDGAQSTPIVVNDPSQTQSQTQTLSQQAPKEPIVVNLPETPEAEADEKKSPKKETMLEYYVGDAADDIVFVIIFILFNMKFVTQLIAPWVPIVSVGGEPSFLTVLIRAILARLAVHGLNYLLVAIS